MHPRWLVRFAVAAVALPFPAAAPAQSVYPRAIASGLGGFGFAPMSGSIGSGASFAGYGYVFVPGVGFQPASTFTPESYGSPVKGAPRMPVLAFVTFKVPPGTEIWLNGRSTNKPGAVRTFRFGHLRPGVVYTHRVEAHWMEGGRPVDRSRRLELRAGERVTVDFTRPTP